jgi:hypothetical protein
MSLQLLPYQRAPGEDDIACHEIIIVDVREIKGAVSDKRVLDFGLPDDSTLAA